MKHTLLIIALLWALEASGQIYIDSYRFGGGAPPATLLLDDYPNAAGAYSLRKLRTAYTGNCIEVRRSIDNATSNIGFSGNYLDTVALKNFCASTDCFVQTWYDQSTNARHATQTTNTSNQAQIAISGVIIRHDGEPAIDGDNTDSYTITSVSTVSIFLVAKVDVRNIVNYTIGATNGGASFGGSVNPSGGISFFDGTNDVSTTVYDLNEHLVSYLATGASAFIAVDGVIRVSNTFNPVNATTLLNRPGFSFNFNGKVKEIVIYSTNQSTSRTGIESNINSFYNTY